MRWPKPGTSSALNEAVESDGIAVANGNGASAEDCLREPMVSDLCETDDRSLAMQPRREWIVEWIAGCSSIAPSLTLGWFWCPGCGGANGASLPRVAIGATRIFCSCVIGSAQPGFAPPGFLEVWDRRALVHCLHLSARSKGRRLIDGPVTLADASRSAGSVATCVATWMATWTGTVSRASRDRRKPGQALRGGGLDRHCVVLLA